MAVTKRVRFEILRRDSNTCQYCGQMAPDVPLHIDHVIPVALGGSDDPGNLVTACKDCNAGKTSISPDSPIVAAVADRSAAFALAQANRGAQIESDLLAINDYRSDFEDAWLSWSYREGEKQSTMPLPDDWKRSIATWWRMSVPLALLLEAIPTAMTSKGRNQTGIAPADRFRYFAGIVWRALEDYDAMYPVGSTHARVYSETEREEYGTNNWHEGYEAASARADHRAMRAAVKTGNHILDRLSARDLIRHHIDGTTAPVVQATTLSELAGGL